MPGFELIGKKEFNNIKKIFTQSNGVLFAQLKTDLALLEKASFNSQVNFTR